MKLISLLTNNFKRLKGERKFDLPDGVIGITGPNGEGKSTIGAAIAWVLFGPDMLPTGKADVVSWGADDCSVALTFELDGTIYHAQRVQLKNGASNAYLYTDTQGIAQGIDATNREIERLLGVDRVGFLISVYARQEELSGLASLTASNRMKAVLRLLGIEQITTAIEQVRAMARDDRKVLEGQREGYDDPQIIEEELNRVVAEQQKAADDRTALEDRLNVIQKEQDALVIQSVAVIPQIQAYQIYIDRRTKAQVACSAAEAELRASEHVYDQIEAPETVGPEPEPVDEEYMAHVSEEVAVARSEIKALSERLDGLTKSSKCYACDRPFDHAADLLSQINALTRRFDELNEINDTQYAELVILRGAVNARLEWKLRTEKRHRHDQTVQAGLDRQQRARAVVTQTFDALDALVPVMDVSEEMKEIQENRLKTEIAAGRIRESLATLAEYIRNLSEDWETTVNLLAIAKQRKDKIAELEESVISHETAANELTRLKETLISQVIPAVSEKASSLVSKFTDGRYTEVNLTSDYEIQYRNEFGELKSFDNLSGGEKDVFALALRLALADLRADSIGVLLLDEVLESLDPDRQEATWNAIERLTKRYNQILLITHVEKFKDRAATVIGV